MGLNLFLRQFDIAVIPSTKMKSFSIIIVISLFLFQTSNIFAQKFSYSGINGPSFWGQFNNACSEGANQSPIEIPYDNFIKFTKFDYINFNDSFDVEVENKGNVIEISHNLHGKLMISNREYELRQFHFHTPSEHRVGDNYHDVEAHFVFADEKDNLSVVAIFYDVSNIQNKFLDPIIANIPTKYGYSSVELIKLSDINPLDKAYKYFGSLTTPPCKEGVIWWITGSVQPISVNQLLKLRDTTGFNSRPIQYHKSYSTSISIGNTLSPPRDLLIPFKIIKLLLGMYYLNL